MRMAKVTKHLILAEQRKGEPLGAFIDREQRVLDMLIQRSDNLPEGEIVNGVVSFPCADGQRHCPGR